MGYINFDELLASIHNGNDQSPVVSDAEEAITIDVEKRIFIIPNNFNTKIGTTNDYNSNELTFICPKTIDNHDISKCSHAVIKWYNTISLMLGSAELSREPLGDDKNIKLKWVVPPEALTKAGPLQIALCFCDIVKDDVGNDTIVYKWNSEICNSFSVAQGLDNVSITGVPLSRIVTIDMYNRTLSIPSSFNTTIANVGDTGISKITFRINRFYDDIDFSYAGLIIRWIDAIDTAGQTILEASRIIESLSGNNKDDWMEFDWEVPYNLSQNAGNIEIIATLFMPSSAEEKVYVWNSNPFRQFKIGEGSNPNFMPSEQPELGLTIIPKDRLKELLLREYNYEYPEEGGI